MEQEPTGEQAVRFSNEALAFIFSKAIESFTELREREQPAAFSRDLFTHTFNFGVEQLDLSEDDAARMMKTARMTVRRWAEGKSAPHRFGRASVFSEFLKEANRRIEESAE